MNQSLQEDMATLLSQSEAQRTELVLLNEEVDIQDQKYSHQWRRSSEKYITTR